MAALPTMPAGLSSEAKLEGFLTDLACRHDLAASTQDQAFNALLSKLCCPGAGRDLPSLGCSARSGSGRRPRDKASLRSVRATKPARAYTNATSGTAIHATMPKRGAWLNGSVAGPPSIPPALTPLPGSWRTTRDSGRGEPVRGIMPQDKATLSSAFSCFDCPVRAIFVASAHYDFYSESE